MAKEPIQHFDLIGREIKLDDPVAYSSRNGLYVAKAHKLTPKMVRVAWMGRNGKQITKLVYGSDLVVLPYDDWLSWELSKGKC